MVGGSDYSKIAEQLGDGDEGRRSTQSRLHSPDGGGGGFGRSPDPCAFKDPAPLLWGRGSRKQSDSSLTDSQGAPAMCLALWQALEKGQGTKQAGSCPGVVDILSSLC